MNGWRELPWTIIGKPPRCQAKTQDGVRCQKPACYHVARDGVTTSALICSVHFNVMLSDPDWLQLT